MEKITLEEKKQWTIDSLEIVKKMQQSEEEDKNLVMPQLIGTIVSLWGQEVDPANNFNLFNVILRWSKADIFRIHLKQLSKPIDASKAKDFTDYIITQYAA